ncbi:DinB family protein [Brevibacillus sp. B_LB10_24]|uniref:DinB family protein n=1 Tax=Brevibacillus sp. B_LB10_24 TaxID=3380645 RepID=UPI0038BA2B36
MTDCIAMYDYHVWANKRMFARLKELPPAVYKQEVQSIFSSIAKAMAHIYMVDDNWLQVLSGTSMREALAFWQQHQDEAEAKTIEELEAMYSDLADRYRAFFRQQADLEKAIVLDNPYAWIRDTRLSEIIMQVVNHGTYHRGNVSAMLRQMGHASVMTEYALFWYQDEPKAAT